MKKPKSLIPGDTIAILSTARKISLEEIQFSINVLESWGLKVVIGATIGTQENQFAGSDEIRARDFQKMLDNKNIKAILCARGGYGTIRILDKLNFTQFMLNPKWIIGYSDITVLHTHINTYLAVQTIHATMPINFETNIGKSLNSLKKSLFGEKISYNINFNKNNRLGDVKGDVIGGNLSILYSLLGTKSGFNTDNKILFIEDVDEMLYHVDRMIVSLKNAGKFNKIKALIVGGMSNMRDNTKEFGFSNENPFGKTVKEIILEHTKEFDFPICFEMPFGHLNENNAIVFGKEVNLSINKKATLLEF